jgi:hypothetical protein
MDLIQEGARITGIACTWGGPLGLVLQKTPVVGTFRSPYVDFSGGSRGRLTDEDTMLVVSGGPDATPGVRQYFYRLPQPEPLCRATTS